MKDPTERRIGRTFDPRQVGWRIGRAVEPRAGEMWCPWDRTAGVIGPQGSGKTLDLLTPALLDAPGAALVTLTKTDDLLLSITARGEGGRPTVVLDPFAQADGLPELVWDPVAGCVDPITAERRAKAFTQGTIQASARGGSGDTAARFYAGEAAKVLQCYFHAAALGGHNLDTVLEWVARPLSTPEPAEILLNHPAAAGFWHGLLQGALTGDDRTAGNTVTTVQQAMSLFFQPSIRNRCVPRPGRPATDIAAVIRDRGTFYLLGREDPYASASPLMTALAEHILDTALSLANDSAWGRLCPPMLACLDELPSTAPLPTLRTRMANERALGLSFIYAAQTYRQLVSIFGESEARALLGLTNVLVMFGGSKDVAFNKEVSDLVGTTRVARTTWQMGNSGGRSAHGDDMLILRPEEVRQLPEKTALVVAENCKPIIAGLTRCVEGKAGTLLLDQQRAVRHQLQERRAHQVSSEARAVAALASSTRDRDHL
jgi:type IV secretion system protein VirD4